MASRAGSSSVEGFCLSARFGDVCCWSAYPCCSLLSRSSIPLCRQTMFYVSSQQSADTVCPLSASVNGAAGNTRVQDFVCRFSIFVGVYLLATFIELLVGSLFLSIRMYLNRPKQKRGSCHENIGVGWASEGTGTGDCLSISTSGSPCACLSVSPSASFRPSASFSLSSALTSFTWRGWGCCLPKRASYQGRVSFSGLFLNSWDWHHIWQIRKAPPILIGCRFSLFID